MADATQYKPTLAWRTIANKVVKLTKADADSPATYRLTVYPVDRHELGSGTKQTGMFLMSFMGNPYTIIAVGTDTVDVEDSFRVRKCPTSGKTAIVYKSVGNGKSPFLAPVYYRFLHESALENSKRFELDILWKKLYDETYTLDPAKWVQNTFNPLVDFGATIGQENVFNGNKSIAIGQGLTTQAFLELIIGAYSKSATGQNPTEWIDTDYLLTLGNGPDSLHQSNALEVWKSGLIKTYNALLIGEYKHGEVDPVNGMLQYTDLGGLEIWDNSKWNVISTIQVIETPIGDVDGVNTIFGTRNYYMPKSIMVFVNGLREHNFVETNDTTITLDTAPKNTGFTDYIEVTYIKK